MQSRRHQSTAFSLIELLILVAIIAILCATAVPNFLEAETRAKTGQVKADMRTLMTAVETYAVDWNGAYPPHQRSDGSIIEYPERYLPLTMPIAYLNSTKAAEDIFLTDPLLGSGGPFIWFSWTNCHDGQPAYILAALGDTHRWFLRSCGPDRIFEEPDVRYAFLTGGIEAAPSMVYDPTNGVFSRGDIFRTAAGQF